ncbi:unnamed protein product [Bursaphelenchus okinawaensis]|uniref:Uncharacterized protein n=1 Tax=Bursaphelenchus okinawaensis TaxID=465554 RepID=A0A811JU03_9BILA|nr:unnamed protein product [Bursaphelenchus okinawaensis]CAG9083824.1 unnamed protein product [Bursaphelenchus okinawaensis]
MNLLIVYLFVWAANGLTDDPESRVPDPPENVRGKAETDSVTLWWDAPSSAPNPLVRGYTLSYGTETPNRKIVIAASYITAYTVSGLASNTTYVFALTAYNEAEGEDSERVLISLTTLPSKDVPESQKIEGPEIKLKAISPSEIKVKWTEPRVNKLAKDFKKTVYAIQYWNVNDENEKRKMTTEGLKGMISHLEPGQKYAVRVKAVLPDGRETEWSKTKAVATPSQVIPENGFVEKCDFESGGQCDFVSEANAEFEWSRVPTDNGHSMLLDTNLGSNDDANGFGRLISPVFQLKKSSHICSSLHYYITPGSKGLFKLSILFEGQEMERALPLFEKSLVELPQGLWQKIVVETKARNDKGFQLLLEGARNGKTGFKLNVDNVTVIAGQCPEPQRHFGNVTGNFYLFYRLLEHLSEH